jgi:hypothetical protein
MRAARAAAVLTWVYAAGFGLPVIPVSGYLLSRGRLLTFFDLFPMYGGPWYSRLDRHRFVAMLAAFLGVTGVAAWSARSVWHGRKAGAVVNLALLPVEAIFWVGFALPLPWLNGIARAGLLATAWKSLAEGQSSEAPSEKRAVAPLAGA